MELGRFHIKTMPLLVFNASTNLFRKKPAFLIAATTNDTTRATGLNYPSPYPTTTHPRTDNGGTDAARGEVERWLRELKNN